jgi:uncharacterized membrane protein YidH (DUF202 family)
MTPTTPNGPLNTFLAVFQAQIVTPLVSLIALAAFLLFIWGVVEYVRSAENEEKRKIGQQHILWGLVGLALIFGATAVVKIIGSLVTVLFNSTQ